MLPAYYTAYTIGFSITLSWHKQVLPLKVAVCSSFSLPQVPYPFLQSHKQYNWSRLKTKLKKLIQGGKKTSLWSQVGFIWLHGCVDPTNLTRKGGTAAAKSITLGSNTQGQCEITAHADNRSCWWILVATRSRSRFTHAAAEPSFSQSRKGSSIMLWQLSCLLPPHMARCEAEYHLLSQQAPTSMVVLQLSCWLLVAVYSNGTGHRGSFFGPCRLKCSATAVGEQHLENKPGIFVRAGQMCSTNLPEVQQRGCILP